MTGGPGSESASEPMRRATVAAALGGLAVITGVGLPIAGGYLLPLVAVAVVAVIASMHRARLEAWITAGGGWAERHAKLSPAQRGSVLVLVGLPVAVVVAVAGRVIGSLLVAFPAAAWAGVALAAGATVVAYARGRARGPAIVVAGLLVVGSGVFGERWEAAAPQARGWAHSGPILGIHPFQTTAVLVDGLGPYDLPLNDYVEPDGSRGYGPQTLADALQRALVAIAEQHYGDGPIRSRRAFADARVEAVTTNPVWERLDEQPSSADPQPRFVVYSGTTGQRSRVEFVCPGKQDDPSGMPSEQLLKRMCPNKYVSEASAGLGVTGRWTGYAEARGNERFGLSRALGWTRSDDEVGQRLTHREVRWWAWITLALALAVSAVRRRDLGGAVTSASVGVCGVVAVLVTAWLLWAGVTPVVGAVEQAPQGHDLGSARAWLPLALVAGGAWIAGPAGGRGQGRRGWLWAAAVAVATLGVSAWVAADAWVRPETFAHRGGLAMERFVLAAADAISERGGLSILEVEGLVAGVLVAVTLGALLAGLRVLGWVAAPGEPGRQTAIAAVVVALACALVVSRKTDGGSALLPVAVVTLTILGSGLWLVARPRARWRAAVHVAVLVVGLLISLRSLADLPPHPFVTLCTVVAVAALLSALSFALRHAAGPVRAPDRDD